MSALLAQLTAEPTAEPTVTADDTSTTSTTTPATARKRPDSTRTDAAKDRTRAINAARCLKRGHAVTRSGNRSQRDD